MIILPALVIDRVDTLPALPVADLDRAASYARQDKAPSTRAAYRADFAAFQSFCNIRGVASLPATPETVAGFLASEAESGLKPLDHRPAQQRDQIRPQARRPRTANQQRDREGDAPRHPPRDRGRARPQGARRRRNSPRHDVLGTEWPKGSPRPRANLLGLLWRVSTIRTRGTRCRRPRRNR